MPDTPSAALHDRRRVGHRGAVRRVRRLLQLLVPPVPCVERCAEGAPDVPGHGGGSRLRALRPPALAAHANSTNSSSAFHVSTPGMCLAARLARTRPGPSSTTVVTCIARSETMV